MTHRWNEILDVKKRAVSKTKVEQRFASGYAVTDEFHEANRKDSALMKIMRSVRVRYVEATITWKSGIPWAKSPQIYMAS